MKKRKIKWVDSYKNIPKYKERGITGAVSGIRENSTDEIYLIRGKAGKYTEQHEICHSIHNDPSKPRDPYNYINQEIRANIYAYKKTGHPKGITMRIRAIYTDVQDEYPDVSYKKRLSMMKRSLSSNNAPKMWFDDLDKVRKEALEVNKD